MPIKTENLARYPKNWKQIRARKRKQADDKCERCGLANGLNGYRDGDGVFHPEPARVLEVWTDSGEEFKCFKIVLTVAHLDHQPENNADKNLQLLCQKCHLDHDRLHHKESRYMTRRARRMTLELPL